MIYWLFVCLFVCLSSLCNVISFLSSISLGNYQLFRIVAEKLVQNYHHPLSEHTSHLVSAGLSLSDFGVLFAREKFKTAYRKER